MILEVVGEVDLYNADLLKQHLREVSEAGAHAVVNLGRVAYIDSSGIGALISGRGALEKSGGSLRLCEIQPSVLQVMQMTRLVSFFDIHDTEATALEAVPLGVN